MSLIKSGTFAMSLAFASFAPQFVAAQTAVEIPQATLDGIAAQCAVSPDACLAAVQAALQTLGAAYPSISIESLVGALVSEIASVANNAVLGGNLGLTAALSAAVSAVGTVAASAGVAPALLATLTTVANAVAGGQVVDIAAVAEAAGNPVSVTPAPNTQASPI